MSIPELVLPIPQVKIKDTVKRLTEHMSGLSGEVRIVQEMLRVLRNMCSHPNKTAYQCSDCGQTWDD